MTAISIPVSIGRRMFDAAVESWAVPYGAGPRFLFSGRPAVPKRSEICGSFFIPPMAGRPFRFSRAHLHSSIRRARRHSKRSRRLADSLRDFCSLFFLSDQKAVFFIIGGLHEEDL